MPGFLLGPVAVVSLLYNVRQGYLGKVFKVSVCPSPILLKVKISSTHPEHLIQQS